jgi:SAM-dependent methyltransferase
VTDASLRALARAAAASYPPHERFARHFAYGKLTGDPVYAHLLDARLLPAGARVLDLGCGQGLLAALLDAAGTPPASYVGVDLSTRDIERARGMGKPWASFVTGDIRTCEMPRSDVIVLLDVLHYVDHDAQARILERIRAALGPGGRLVLRVANATGSLRFRLTDWSDRLAMRLRGQAFDRLWSRPVDDWRVELARHGFAVESAPMSAGTPFANVLLTASYDGSQ